MDMEQIVCAIIANSGDCRSSCLCAVQAASNRDFLQAHTLMEESEKALQTAHDAHSELLVLDARGALPDISLLMIHALDHLSAAETVHDLVESMIILLEEREHV